MLYPQRLSQGELRRWSYALLIANALVPFIRGSLDIHGIGEGALRLFDVSAIAWLAIVAALALLRQDGSNEPLTARDFAFAAGVTVTALVPFAPLSALVLTALALWDYLTHPAHSAARRAAAILLSLSAFLIWGRLILTFGSGPLLEADARFVSWLSGMPALGNTVSFSDGTKFMIAPGCSSLHGISLALVLWTVVIQYFSLAMSRRLLLTLAFAVLSAIAVNGLRLTAIAWNPRKFDYWHYGDGSAIFGWLALLAVTATVYFGSARAVRAA